ncbi:MAG: AAA family ATPase [Acidobacteria bacterium]|nr:AAA family ATPase [Acidobacteriota bacterium]
MVPKPAFLNRVRLANYKSIASCDVELGPITFLVGPNGSGKSNFLDALRFVSNSLNHSLEYSFRERGGIDEVRRRSGGHPNNFSISLELSLDGSPVKYGFHIAAKPNSDFEVRREYCEVVIGGSGQYYEVTSGIISKKSFDFGPPASADRLYLVAAAGLPQFRALFNALSRMSFYNLNPEQIREPQSPNPGTLLRRDGSNLASVLKHIEKSSPGVKARIQRYLTAIVSDLHDVEYVPVGHKETLEFRMQVDNQRYPWKFSAVSMSDGTLRALGVLVALFQSANGGQRAPLVGIEEPEAAVHPGAAAVLRDALFEGIKYSQILVTSHSPDLLDDDKIDPDSILAVEMQHGVTAVGQLDTSRKSILRDKLFTAGDLLRQSQLTPASRVIDESKQPSLFPPESV